MFKKKTKVSERIEKTQMALLEEFETVDPASEEAGKYAANIKTLSESKAIEEKTESGKMEWWKALLIALIPAAIGGAINVGVEMMKENARKDEVETLLGWENTGEVNRIPTSPTSKRFLNSGPK